MPSRWRAATRGRTPPRQEADGRREEEAERHRATSRAERSVRRPGVRHEGGELLQRVPKKCGTPTQPDRLSSWSTNSPPGLPDHDGPDDLSPHVDAGDDHHEHTTGPRRSAPTRPSPPSIGPRTAARTVLHPGRSAVSGELADVAGTGMLADLGLGCLNIGGGGATILPPSQIPANAVNILDSAGGTTLVASFGTGPRDCSRGPQSTFHCVNDPTLVCSTDADCGGSVGACAADPNCSSVPRSRSTGSFSTRVINTLRRTRVERRCQHGDSAPTSRSPRVYPTIGQPSTRPHCDGGICSWDRTESAHERQQSGIPSTVCRLPASLTTPHRPEPAHDGDGRHDGRWALLSDQFNRGVRCGPAE
jgi:hypothetical protein